MADNWPETASTGSSLTLKLNVTSAGKLVCKEVLRWAIDRCKTEAYATIGRRDTSQGLKCGQ